jgi:hypothetical protein
MDSLELSKGEQSSSYLERDGIEFTTRSSKGALLMRFTTELQPRLTNPLILNGQSIQISPVLPFVLRLSSIAAYRRTTKRHAE